MEEATRDKDNPSIDKKIKKPTASRNENWLTDNKTRIMHIVAATVLPLLLLSALYFIITLNQLSDRLTELSYHVGAMEVRTVTLENKQTELHGKLTQLDGKVTSLSDSPALKDVETLAPRVNLLEKQLESMQVRKKVTPVRAKSIGTDKKKQYYEVKEGDNLFRISKTYGLSVEELASMNNLHEEELILVGQRLVVSK